MKPKKLHQLKQFRGRLSTDYVQSVKICLSKSRVIKFCNLSFHLLTERCSLCYNLTKSTPGFAADPNNCQKFYMCERTAGSDKWNAFPMTCPNCTFWNQEKLTCVAVYSDPDDTGVCGYFEPVTGVAPVPTHGKCCLSSYSCTK